MKIGDTVTKKSGKPFQNKEKEAVVAGFTTMVIPKNHTLTGTIEVSAVFLEGCAARVRESILTVKH